MGKADQPSTAGPSASEASGSGRYLDHPEDPPPQYEEVFSGDVESAQPLPTPFKHDASSDTAYYVDESLSTDPTLLEATLRRLSQQPPRPFAVIRGTHTDTRRDSDGDRESRQVVDFDLEIEMTHLLFAAEADVRADDRLRGVDNGERVRRGTVMRARGPPDAPAPSVQEWCHRFCASGGLKQLTLHRRVEGWDWACVRRRLEDAVRATNYRGTVSVSFPVRNARVEVYSEGRANRWRLTRWVVVVCALSLVFVVAWPWLWLRTKRWETVYARWELAREDARGGKRYTSLSEEAWCDMWVRSVQRAVLERRRGRLHRGDLEGQGQGAVQDSLQGTLGVMGAVDRWFGWGGDEVFYSGCHHHRRHQGGFGDGWR